MRSRNCMECWNGGTVVRERKVEELPGGTEKRTRSRKNRDDAATTLTGGLTPWALGLGSREVKVEGLSVRVRVRVWVHVPREGEAEREERRAMMLNDCIQNMSKLQSSLAMAEELLSKLIPNTPFSDFEYELQGLGFEKGWGDTAEKVSEMVHLLLDIFQAPDPNTLETFLGRIPMVFNVVIVSPHGYFGQANIVDLPDTGGQDHSLLIFP